MFSQANYREMLKISEMFHGEQFQEEKLDFPKALIVECHASLFPQEARRLAAWCILPQEPISPCPHSIELDCRERCPGGIGEICQVVGLKFDKRLMQRLLSNSPFQEATQQAESELDKLVL